MPARSLRASGLPSTDYYAPDYKITVEGQELDPTSKGDVLEVKVTMDLDNMTHFDLTVNNWDDKHLTFKYSDTTTFDLGNRVHVQMGYAGRLLSMVEGLITSLTPRFPESGPPTLAVGGEDRMVKLKERKPRDGEQKKFVNKDDGDIVRVIAQRNGLVPKIQNTGITHDIVIQKNQDDAAFLMERAKRIDFDCFIGVDPDTGLDALYFQSPTDARNGSRVRVYVFEWGKNLINFNPTISLNRQVGKVTVKSWDPNTKSIIQYIAGPGDLPTAGGGENGPAAIQARLQDREDIVVDQPVTSQQEAKALAQALLRERAYSYITASGQVIGLPDLRPGDNIEVQGVGKRFSSKYYVTKVEHTLGSSGYMTSFDVRNYVDGGTKG
ncbi:MAG: Phage late control protein [Firmicutes bacterium]|nr:Phage late control protein [Bacillota bacterium]